jgi:hypothetical protein
MSGYILFRRGRVVLDNGGGGSSSPSALPTPLLIVNSNHTIAPAETWLGAQAVAGGYTLTWGPILPGVIYRITHVGGAVGSNLFATPGQAVNLDRGANTFTMVDPQNSVLTPPSAGPIVGGIRTSQVTYNFALDAIGGVLRCIGLS